ncbi:MAG: hypothetical protein O4861_22465 [Trichodesmium sp. St16_bin4-tuft]|nr:hypothetical protein [Trichodesmium sp. MAG_R01]MDE5071678.1 hypothetical protein [Trichodesmium sp. St5_bin8]MDE5077119.1 hypothetical protein [Trichodesmium sp. St2_bin6]MDE5091085.1 hypothetical protein [Trichodesmium sp. St18_bin3_1_1]MDE5100943.1 hypothetical protein [Trichodesmium sp. St16_bin4-tuft]
MAINWKSFSGTIIFCAIANLTSIQVAQGEHLEDTAGTYQPFAEKFNRASQRRSGNFFRKRNLLHQIGRYFGIPKYPEQAIESDNTRVNRLYIDEQRRQFSSTPVIRTPDIINPYNQSVLAAPPSESTPTFGGN